VPEVVEPRRGLDRQGSRPVVGEPLEDPLEVDGSGPEREVFVLRAPGVVEVDVTDPVGVFGDEGGLVGGVGALDPGVTGVERHRRPGVREQALDGPDRVDVVKEVLGTDL